LSTICKSSYIKEFHTCHLNSTTQRNNARFLWKRIPAAVKQADNELSNVWQLVVHAWKREQPLFHKKIKETFWSDSLKPLINAVKGTVDFLCFMDATFRSIFLPTPIHRTLSKSIV
jgi:hypothetical protein